MTMPTFDPPTHHMVDGVQVPYSQAEADAIVAGWQANWIAENNRQTTLAGLDANTTVARQRWWNYTALRNKTPDEIYTIVQGRVDGWTSLAQAKADLRDWLPMLASMIAWVLARDVTTSPTLPTK